MIDETSYPDFPLPIPETQRTVAPGDATYSTRKVAMEQTLLDRSPVPVSVVRPCAIHGPGSRSSREWYFLKRSLDGRPVFIHSFRGESIFHTTSVENLADLICLAAEKPGTRVLNSGDPDPPNVLRNGRAVAATVDHAPIEVLVDSLPAPNVGESPWTGPRSLILDMAKASELGYRPVTSYEEAVASTCAWLRGATRDRDWREALPDLARFPGDLFDYAAEDTFVSALSALG